MRDIIASICVLVGFMMGFAVGITVERARIAEAVEHMADVLDVAMDKADAEGIR